MQTLIWFCQGPRCYWAQTSDFDTAIEHAPSVQMGQLQNFPAFGHAVSLADTEAFCVRGIRKADLAMDLIPPPYFSLVPAGGAPNLLHIWWHHSPNVDFWQLAVVSTGSRLHRGGRDRPSSWQEALPTPAQPNAAPPPGYTAVRYAELSAAVAQMS